MSWSVIRPQIKTLLESVSGIQEVSSSPKVKFTGYPAAYVVPSDNEGDYETTTENIRTYAFIVRLFYETKDTGVATALDALEDIVDSVLDKFDLEDRKGSSTRTVGVSLPATYTYINIWAAPSVWSELVGENLLMSEIRVRVRVSIDIS